MNRLGIRPRLLILSAAASKLLCFFFFGYLFSSPGPVFYCRVRRSVLSSVCVCDLFVFWRLLLRTIACIYPTGDCVLATVVHKKKEKEIAVDIWKKSTDESSSFFVPPGLKTSNLLRIEHTDKHTKHTHPRYLHCNNVHSETTLPQLIGSVCFVFLNWPFVWQDTTVLYIYIY